MKIFKNLFKKKENPLENIIDRISISFLEWVIDNGFERAGNYSGGITYLAPEKFKGTWRKAKSPIVVKDSQGQLGRILNGYDYYTAEELFKLYEQYLKSR